MIIQNTNNQSKLNGMFNSSKNVQMMNLGGQS